MESVADLRDISARTILRGVPVAWRGVIWRWHATDRHYEIIDTVTGRYFLALRADQSRRLMRILRD